MGFVVSKNSETPSGNYAEFINRNRMIFYFCYSKINYLMLPFQSDNKIIDIRFDMHQIKFSQQNIERLLNENQLITEIFYIVIFFWFLSKFKRSVWNVYINFEVAGLENK